MKDDVLQYRMHMFKIWWHSQNDIAYIGLCFPGEQEVALG